MKLKMRHLGFWLGIGGAVVLLVASGAVGGFYLQSQAAERQKQGTYLQLKAEERQRQERYLSVVTGLSESYRAIKADFRDAVEKFRATDPAGRARWRAKIQSILKETASHFDREDAWQRMKEELEKVERLEEPPRKEMRRHLGRMSNAISELYALQPPPQLRRYHEETWAAWTTEREAYGVVYDLDLDSASDDPLSDARRSALEDKYDTLVEERDKHLLKARFALEDAIGRQELVPKGSTPSATPAPTEAPASR